ncbi:hypothetical protein [Streptomyces sp. AD55]|uniref:hypothetical protein n=1 Tax=Streptomyces sp. AD55 TaxID=3242895 RepID=UPI003527487B
MMGAFLEPTPAMRRYRVEIRAHSAVLSRAYTAPETRESRHSAALPAPDQDAILAAVEQAATHRPEHPGTDQTTPPSDDTPSAWTVARTIDALWITGPWTVNHERDVWSAEIAYSDLPALRNALAP